MIQATIATAALVLGAVLAVTSAHAQDPSAPLSGVTTATPYSGTVAATASVVVTAEPLATLTVAPTLKTPTAVVPTAVRTPPPNTPTPTLPEEGGPPGGVLGGHLYIDQNGNGARDEGEGTTGGVVSLRGLDLVDGGHAYIFGAASDISGYWEFRAVPDGSYQVYWQPPIPDDQLGKTIPPAESLTLTPNLTIRAIARTVEIKGANRILDIDFGVPPQAPLAGSRVQLPGTGAKGSGSSSASAWLVASALAICFAALGVATIVRRRARNE